MARASSGPVKTFSIGFTKDDFNESKYARMVAQKFGTDHHEMILEPDVVQTVEHLTSTLEEPFGDSSMSPRITFRRWRASMSRWRSRETVATSCLPDTTDTAFTPTGGSSSMFLSGRAAFPAIRFREFASHDDQGRKFSYNVSLPWRERYVDGLSFVPAFERDMPLLSDDFREVLRRSDDPQNVMMRYFAKRPQRIRSASCSMLTPRPTWSGTFSRKSTA